MGSSEGDVRLGHSLSDRRLRLWASDAFVVPPPAGHPFPMERYRALRERLLAEGVVATGDIVASEPAPIAWLTRAHDPAWVERVLAGALEDGVAGNLAGGTHHAFRDRGEGYCLFNDHAVRTNYPLQKEESSLDVELEDATGDATYLALLDCHLEPALDRHHPDAATDGRSSRPSRRTRRSSAPRARPATGARRSASLPSSHD